MGWIGKHLLGLFGLFSMLLPVGSWILKAIQRGGDIDFVVERIKDPSWIRDVIQFLLDLPPLANLTIIAFGLLLIYLDSRRRIRAILAETGAPTIIDSDVKAAEVVRSALSPAQDLLSRVKAVAEVVAGRIAYVRRVLEQGYERDLKKLVLKINSQRIDIESVVSTETASLTPDQATKLTHCHLLHKELNRCINDIIAGVGFESERHAAGLYNQRASKLLIALNALIEALGNPGIARTLSSHTTLGLDEKSRELAGVVNAMMERAGAYEFRFPLPDSDAFLQHHEMLKSSAHPIWTNIRVNQIRREFLNRCHRLGAKEQISLNASEFNQLQHELRASGRYLIAKLLGETADPVELPLEEAARIAYEETRGGQFSKSAEGYDGTDNGIIQFYAFHILATATLFGKRPPSTRIEQINAQNPRVFLRFVDGHLEAYRNHSTDRFRDLEILHLDLVAAINRFKESDRGGAANET